MKNLVYTSTIILVTAVITSVGITSLVDERFNQEQRLSHQMAIELDELRKDLVLLNQRLEQMTRMYSIPTDYDNRYPDRTASSDEILSGNSDEKLRDLVRSLIKEERTARHAAIRETQWQQLRNWQDNREGPYGKYNVRVNSITKTLDLDYTQTSYYHTLLSDYEEQANALYEEVSSSLPDQESDINNLQTLLDEIELEKRRLDETFDQTFVQSLSPEQVSRYEQLPPEERGIGPDAGLDSMQFQFSDLRRLAAKQ
ncbi:MAG: hypothetical protein WBP44_03645 [Gammaproteobacteria bacterium]|jgi:hypothetical protein